MTVSSGLSVPNDPLSSMTPRFNFVFKWFAGRFFRHFQLDPDTVKKLRELETGGAVVYVMRYSSRLDYFLFNTLFAREGLRLSSFANGLHYFYYRPIFELIRTLFRRPRGRPHEVVQAEARGQVRELARSQSSFFLFLRTARFRTWLSRRARRRQDELDLLEELTRAVWDSGTPVHVVPLALFWRKGPRSDHRFLNLSYGALVRPTDLSKVMSFLVNYRSLSVKTGEPIDLQRFLEEHRDEGPAQVARKVRRSILMYLYREEKVVEGPTLRSPQRVMDEVLTDPGVRAAMEQRSREKRGSEQKSRAAAEKMFREIAADMNSTMLAMASWVLNWVFGRMFSGLEIAGLEKVANYAKNHPIVLVPSHRSYFDFLIMSWLFYQNFLVPPHIAARENMAFGPFGFLFRRMGAFFLRRSFSDPLYKEVFRSYVAYLVKEGFTQEFFIEGGRSRTGKTMSPRLGMLTWDVDAFIDSARGDFFFVPVSIIYERLVEESSMVDELEGGEKQAESMLGLVRARRFLKSRFGSVHVSFGEPISLAQALGERRQRFAGEKSDEYAAEKRQFIDALGYRIVERINWSAVANATSVAAVVLLGSEHRGLRRQELVTRMQQIVDLLVLQDVRLTKAFAADQGDFSESIAFLLRSDLICSDEDTRGEILYFEESRRRALDIYRNSIVHYLAAPSILARRLTTPATPSELREDLSSWQDLLYQEFYPPRAEVLVAHCEGFLDYFERSRWLDRSGESLQVNAAGQAIFDCLAEQTRGVIEAYWVAACTVEAVEGEMNSEELRKLAGDQFKRAQLLGEVLREEAANETTFANALDLMVRRGMLDRQRVPGKKKGSQVTTYSRGENWTALASLRQQLADGVIRAPVSSPVIAPPRLSAGS